MGGALTAPGRPANPPVPSTLPYRRILLVGFMGSGKSTVGPLLGDELGWRYVDADEVVEARAGRPIARIFREDGEAAFRRLEDEVTRGLLTESSVVIASGGGWPCAEGRLDAVGEGGLSIWLRVRPDTALQRTREQARIWKTERPLLSVERPLERIRELLRQREPFYGRADWTVSTEGRSPREVARMVLDRLRTEPERPLRE